MKKKSVLNKNAWNYTNVHSYYTVNTLLHIAIELCTLIKRCRLVLYNSRTDSNVGLYCTLKGYGFHSDNSFTGECTAHP